MPTDRRVTTNGKEVLLDGKHFGDGVSEDAASCLADALEYFWPDGCFLIPHIPAENMANIAKVMEFGPRKE